MIFLNPKTVFFFLLRQKQLSIHNDLV